MAVFPELHVPVPLASDNIVVNPLQTLVFPVIVADVALTLTIVVCLQPVPRA